MNFKLLLAFIIICFSLTAQKNKVDSLQKLIATDQEDTIKVMHLNQRSWSEKNIGLYKEALETSMIALELGEKLNFRRGVADAYNLKGVVFTEQGDYRKALENYAPALEIRLEIGDKKGMAAAYNNLGLVYQSSGNPGKALENFSAAIKINKETGNKNWLANNHNNIGNLYSAQGKQDLALENYLIAKKIKEETGDTKDPHYTNIVSNIGNAYFYKQDYNKALEIFNSMLQIRIEIGDRQGTADSYVAIGSVFFEQMKAETTFEKRKDLSDKTLEYFKKGLEIEKEIGDVEGAAVAHLNSGSLYLAIHDITEARGEYLSSLRISKEIGLNDLIMELSQMLARCDSIDGNWKGAYEYQKMYKQYSDSLFNEENSKKMAEMSTRFETEKKEAQIGQLEKEKKQTRMYLGVFGTLAVGVLFFGTRAYNNKRKLARLMSAESERKEVLLQEVQHRINNNLQIMSSLLALQASSAEDERLHDYLKQSQNRIQSLSTMHELLYQNNSPLKINIHDYLNKVLDFQKDVVSTLPGKVEMITDVADENFPTGVSVPLALIVNELVTNSIKYAFANEESGFIKISLFRDEKSNDKWMLSVSDSGKGLPDNNEYRKNSLGLRLVKIMTQQIKGTLVTSNSPGATFEISFNLSV